MRPGNGPPTSAIGEGCWYQRLVLVVMRASIAWVLFPVRTPVRASAQAVAWIPSHGTQASR